ncbi:nuclear transport factor 2 family protein [Microbulbifer hainanensis]|uniref:nuclear transport factor 2 family protein n=1 Tax=Microbulbifer hainanensis TaxID=2735675 RepID=UPI00186763D5|nr:nuclear transport factor 2 family protein [Microbulbifer hainanensis]
MQSFKWLAAVVLTVSAACTYAKEVSPKEEVAAVVESFRQAIIDKDEKTFTNLFFDQRVNWMAVNGAKRTGSLPSQSGIYIGSYLGLIGWLVSTDVKAEEKFNDIHIMTDGEIASVHFKYSFHEDDDKKNWGDEAWQLVKTPDGWKIVSVIYSIIKNPESAPKKG